MDPSDEIVVEPLAQSVGAAHRRLADGTDRTVLRGGDPGVSKGAEMALQVQGGEGERFVDASGVESPRGASGVRDPAGEPGPLLQR